MASWENFSIKFRGVRGSYPSCHLNFLKYGANTSSVEVRCHNKLIILDCGTGIIDIGLDEEENFQKNTIPHQSTIILTHLHQDHIQGLPFFKPLFNKSSKINLFGLNPDGKDLKDILRTVLFDKVFPLTLDELKSNFSINNFSSDDTIVISSDNEGKIYNNYKKLCSNEDDVIITAYKTLFHPREGCLCIKIEYKNKILVYATDKESSIGADRDFINFAQNCDCLIHDSQYTYEDYIDPYNPKFGFGHSTFEMASEIAKLTNAKKTFFFHYDPEYNDDKLFELEKKYSNEKMFFAKEGLKIEL